MIRHKVFGYSDYVAELEVKHDTLVESIDETGIYRNALTSDWELWYVDEETKKCIGFAQPRLKFDAAKLLWQDFILLSELDVESVYDLEHEVLIQ